MGRVHFQRSDEDVVCFIFLQQMCLLISEHAAPLLVVKVLFRIHQSLFVWKVLLRIHHSVALLLRFGLWGGHGGHFSTFRAKYYLGRSDWLKLLGLLAARDPLLQCNPHKKTAIKKTEDPLRTRSVNGFSGDSIAHSDNTRCRKTWLSTIKHGHHMDGWLFRAKLCTPTVGDFLRSQNSV